jgi:hypothetical protein
MFMCATIPGSQEKAFVVEKKSDRTERRFVKRTDHPLFYLDTAAMTDDKGHSAVDHRTACSHAVGVQTGVRVNSSLLLV